jgi:tRNA(Ile)-lysidine synthase
MFRLCFGSVLIATFLSRDPRNSNRFLLYHFSVHELAEQLLKSIRKHNSIRAGDRVSVAVSGGADSVALLCLLLRLRSELGIVLSVAHVNHKLRGQESDEDADFVRQLAQQHELELYAEDAPIKRRSESGTNKAESSEEGVSGIEAAARHLRYALFRRLALEGKVTKIATAHTLDDQAETVLLRIFRGTGIRGLSGIHPRIVFEEHDQVVGEVIRPLLSFRRAELQEFLLEGGQSWREDSTNRNIAFLRNRVRHELLPLIQEKFGETAIEHMSELAELARAEDEHWECVHPEVWPSALRPKLAVQPLLALPLAAQRRLARRWLEMNVPEVSISFRLIEEVLELARGDSNRGLGLSARMALRRSATELVLEAELPTRTYSYPLTIPGAVEVPELRASVEARIVDTSSISETMWGQLLDVERTPKHGLVRNWHAGDRFWPAHTAKAKKMKELLSDRHVTGPEKKLWPVIEAEGCGIIWVRGLAVPEAFQPATGSAKAIWISETASDRRAQ